MSIRGAGSSYRASPEYDRKTPLQRWAMRVSYEQGYINVDDYVELDRIAVSERLPYLKEAARRRATGTAF